MPVSNQTEFADPVFCIWIVLPLFSSLGPGAFFIPRCSFHLEVCSVMISCLVEVTAHLKPHDVHLLCGVSVFSRLSLNLSSR